MDQQDGAPAHEPAPRRRRRWRRRHVALLLIGATLSLGWIERRTILTRVIDDRLAAAKLPVRYRIADLGPRRQRLTDIVVGDPARPDLVADWVETRTAIGLTGPYLADVAVGRVRLKARLVDGRLSLGTLDPLLRGGDGKGPLLPALRLAITEGRVDLATPAGPVALALSGRGRLDRDFAGVLAAVAPTLRAGSCRAGEMRAALRVRIAPPDAKGGQAVQLDGPLRFARGRCDDARLAGLDGEIAAAIMLGRPSGSSVEARLRTGALVHPALRAASIAGTVTLAHGGGDQVAGQVALTAHDARAGGVAIPGVSLTGGIAHAGGRFRYDGAAAFADANLSGRALRLPAAPGTPVAPLLAALSRAIRTGAQDMSGEAHFHLATGAATQLSVRRVRLRTQSGAYAVLDPGDNAATAVEWSEDAGARIAGRLATGGGGLPTVRARLTRASAAAPLRLAATVAPYAAGGASLALAPVTATIAPDGAVRARTRATLSGPLADGRVEGLTMPVDLRRTAAGTLLIGSGCTPIGVRRLAVQGLALDPVATRLCPTAAALVRVADGRVQAGARLAATTLRGRLGATPLSVAMRGGTLRLADSGFALAGVEARIGAPGRATRIAADTLTGTVAAGGVSGAFGGAGGQIANVPLILSEGAGRWTFAGGALSLRGTASVADAAESPRFRPVAARDIDLLLVDSRIAVTGMLHEPTTGTPVAAVRIAHALPSGIGTAALDVPGIIFREGFQPELLTPLTFGVVADLRGRVDGTARIAWGPDGVVSRGDFGTDSLDLAAAFGPATGIAGRVRFDDLLSLHTPPGQVATVKSVNPGIAVENGTVRYQLLGSTQVQVEGAEWPFAGGALTLDPSLLDFGAERARRLTFHVTGAQAGLFLQQFEFENLNATGVFDGVLPMIFDDSGGRIEDGRLTMREGGGTIAYVGSLGQEQLGFWGDLAFQALRSLRYRTLAIRLSGPLAGELVTDVRFAGVSQGEGAKSNFIIRRLQRLPFVFNVRIRAPFRGLIDSAASFYDPRRLIQRNLPALIEEQNRRAVPPSSVQPPAAQPPSIQPSASETVR